MDSNVSTLSTARSTARRSPRLVIVEEHAAVADVLEASLWGHYRVRSVIRSGQTSVAVTAAATRAARPDVALVASRPGPLLDDETVIARLRADGVPVIVLTSATLDDDPVHWGRCLLAGASSVVSKCGDLADLHEALDRVLSGRSAFCPVVAQQLRDAAFRAAEDDRWVARDRLGLLSLRERMILAKLIFGRSPAEIAREDVVSEATVRSQIKSILAKLDVCSQLGAVAVARRAGWSIAADQPLAS
jgi:two-component system, NarL family, nitrate/nitrite response regulator NarL